MKFGKEAFAQVLDKAIKGAVVIMCTKIGGVVVSTQLSLEVVNTIAHDMRQGEEINIQYIDTQVVIIDNI